MSKLYKFPDNSEISIRNIASSNVEGMEYYESKTLRVFFYRDNGSLGVYEYYNVDSQTALNFKNAPHKGSFPKQYLAGKFEYLKIN